MPKLGEHKKYTLNLNGFYHLLELRKTLKILKFLKGCVVDNMVATDMIEIRTNPVTQKSIIVNHSAFTARLNSTLSSFERKSSMDSDLTSVMDAQYKPHVQLKFAFVSWLVFLVQCSLAASILLLYSSSDPDPFLCRLFSFFYIVSMIAYALMQFIFYVISRDDLFDADSRCWPSFLRKPDRAGDQLRLQDEPELNHSPSLPESSEQDDKGIVNNEIDNLLSEPKAMIVSRPEPSVSVPKIQLDDCIYEKYQFKSKIANEQVNYWARTGFSPN